VLWGYVSEEVEQRLSKGVAKLRLQDWKSGERPWVTEVISPFGGAEEMIRDLQGKVFPRREIKMLKVGGV
jgi:cytolysin-activating lysine-acyltransferase